jgi:integrase
MITREYVDIWFERIARGRPTYRARAYALLRTILGSATDDGYLVINPAKIRGAGHVHRRHQVRPATLEELAVITEAMPPRYRLLVQLAAWCALRFGELTELRRSDIDTKSGVIRVRRAGHGGLGRRPDSSGYVRVLLRQPGVGVFLGWIN